MKSVLRLFLIVGAALSAATSAQTADIPAPASFTVGDSWEWRQVDTRTRLEEGKRTRTAVKVDGVVMLSDGTKPSEIAQAFVGEPASKPWRVWPLEVGKKWAYDGDWVRADGATGNTKQDAQVVAYEEVTVPAGKYMAYKIEYRGWYRNSRGANGNQDDTYWYAPDAKADVKHVRDDGINRYTRELISYKPGGSSLPASTSSQASRFVGTWTLDVEGQSRQRTLVISQEDEMLRVAFGWKEPGAQLGLIQSGLDAGGVLTMRSNTNAVMVVSVIDDNTLRGKFTTGTGKVLNATITRTTPITGATLAVQTPEAQAQVSPIARQVHIVYMGGNDCPPCVVWRALELTKLEKTPVFKRVKFTYVTKTIGSPVPPSFFLPSEVKQYKDKLDYASNGTSGSPHTAILVNGEVFDYRFGVLSAEDFEKALLAILDGAQYPLDRCIRMTRQRACEVKG